MDAEIAVLEGKLSKAREVKAGHDARVTYWEGEVGVSGRRKVTAPGLVKAGCKEFPKKGKINLVKFPKWDKIRNAPCHTTKIEAVLEETP